MPDLSHSENQVQCVSNFEDLLSTPFQEKVNALCWSRRLDGDFSEIIEKVELKGNMLVLEEDELLEMKLSKEGQLAQEILLNDLKVLKAHGASPILNVIENYERDDSFFPTDVYSFHVDRSPVATDTFLCTYHGAASEIVANSQANKKVLVPEIRDELRMLHEGLDEGFEAFLTEYFFDLHYQAKAGTQFTNLGIGHLWKLAVDHPESNVLPCLHRAPKEKAGEKRLMLIC
ncbi:MAG: hypothetical protein ACI857_002654 [Arenicella sp.]|jgi:hypothetical protein